MDHPTSNTRRIVPLLDPSLYALDEASLAFFKSSTDIHDDDQLKEHILNVQAQAYVVCAQLIPRGGRSPDTKLAFQVAPYPCIRSFNFTKLKISKMPAYKNVLKLGQERKGAILLDIGCCFGNDGRKAAADGFPVEQIIASDLKREFWDLGHVLFRSTPESFPVQFIAGNALDPAFLSPFMDAWEPTTEVNLSNISTLNELRGHVSVIWAAGLFYLFSEKDQRQLAHALGRLLSPESGSIIFGIHVASENKGTILDTIAERSFSFFCHNPDSWKELWVGKSTDQAIPPVDSNAGGLDAAVFSPDSVRIESRLIPVPSSTSDGVRLLVWSITRV